jgi:hypothetical protein
MDNASATNADNVVSSIGPSGLTISTIGFGNSALGTSQYAGLDEPRLRSIADRTGGLYAAANDAEALKRIFERYARTLQNEYAISFTSLTRLRDGVNRSLSVSLVAPSGAPINAQSKYNPGGVVPEIPRIPTGLPIFPIALAGLILLLLAPTIIARAGGLTGLNKRGGRIRLGTSSTAFSKTPPSGGRLANARSTVKKLLGGIGRKKKSRVRILDASPQRMRTR